MASLRVWCLVVLGGLLLGDLSAGNAPAPGPIPEGLGVNIHFTNPKPGEFEMIREGGFRWLRMDLRWAETEKVAGTYDFSACDVLAAAAEKHGLRLLLILDYGNPLYDEGKAPYSDAGRAAFVKWAVAAVRHFAGKGILWEIWNEPNLKQFWRPEVNPPDYMKLATAVSRAIREASPGETIIGPATSGVDLRFLELCFQAGLLEYWDAVSVHPYRPMAPETAVREIEDLRVLIARYAPVGKEIPVLSGEWGYSASWKGYDSALQGKMLVRQWLTNLWQGIPVSIWYDWMDDGPDPVDPEQNFGTVGNAYREGQTPVYQPKPAYLAAKQLATELAGLEFNKRLIVDDTGKDYLLIFSSPDQTKVKLVAWTTGSPHEISPPFSTDQFLQGRDKVVGPRVTLSDMPIYLTPMGADELLRKAVEWERFPSYEILPKVPGEIRGNTRILKERQLEGGKFRQWTTGLIRDPLLVTMFPSGARELTVTVAYPAGKVLKAGVRVEIAGIQALSHGTLELTAGQEEAFTKMEFPSELPLRAMANLTLTSAETSELILDTHLGYLATLAKDLGPQTWKITADGDPAVPATFSMDLAPAPDPAPVQAPVLKIDYDFAPGWKYLQLEPAEGKGFPALPGRPRSMSFWVYGDGKGLLPVVRVADRSQEVFQMPARKIDWTGWKKLSVPLDDSTAFHWGGDENGLMDYPLQLVSPLLLDHTDKDNPVSGTVYFTAPMLTWED